MRFILCFIGLFISAAMPAADLWVVDPRGLSTAEQALLASLQGNLNRTNAVLWVQGRGASARVPRELAAEGVILHTNLNVWSALAEFRPRLAGFITCDVTNASFNVATSLAGARQAVIADVSLRERLEGLGLRELLDVRGINEVEAFARYRSEFASGLAVHQPVSKSLHLRDLAVSRNAFTFFDVTAAERSRIVSDLGPATHVFGWGRDEHDFVREVSAGGGLVIPADWALNLSALAWLPTKIPPRPLRPQPEPAKPGERIVAFVVTDGDNVQWMLNGFADAPGFWASPERGKFPVSWEVAPSLVTLAPRVLAHLYRTATINDDFVAGPSGAGYWFPSASPERANLAALTAQSMGPAQLRLVSLLNSGGGLKAADEVVSQTGVDGVLFKDYAPYHRFRGQVRWQTGKPVVSYRFILWEEKGSDGKLRPDWLPAGVAAAIGQMPADPTKITDSFALINVHAWSFGDTGGPMGAIAQTIAQLPTGTRVVTATEFMTLLSALAPKE